MRVLPLHSGIRSPLNRHSLASCQALLPAILGTKLSHILPWVPRAGRHLLSRVGVRKEEKCLVDDCMIRMIRLICMICMICAIDPMAKVMPWLLRMFVITILRCRLSGVTAIPSYSILSSLLSWIVCKTRLHFRRLSSPCSSSSVVSSLALYRTLKEIKTTTRDSKMPQRAFKAILNHGNLSIWT
jgi:hypothetical protein